MRLVFRRSQGWTHHIESAVSAFITSVIQHEVVRASFGEHAKATRSRGPQVWNLTADSHMKDINPGIRSFGERHRTPYRFCLSDGRACQGMKARAYLTLGK